MTDRQRCLRAHHALAQVGSKRYKNKCIPSVPSTSEVLPLLAPTLLRPPVLPFSRLCLVLPVLFLLFASTLRLLPGLLSTLVLRLALLPRPRVVASGVPSRGVPGLEPRPLLKEVGVERPEDGADFGVFLPKFNALLDVPYNQT